MNRNICMRCHLLGKIDLKCRATLLRKALQGINCDLSAEAKMILELIDSLASNAADNEEDFESSALSDFLSQPMLILPLEWAPLMGEITELVMTSIERFHQKKESRVESDSKSL
ncbi:hypothetical protein PRIPAC_96132 [Pristionchus pacificus]|uniref:Uncharacterized protein n=1 Tax=Pristionchus pacificus TaxID=54126 RepID=A0A2A6B2W0_PRIPA|nr:hypothetical protein PRIPAC_96132 [Pristionchus pacificus]|eukprot:PDM60210.1 hypothetical protein PRIPAC_54035 [Pristionchus pacificus]